MATAELSKAKALRDHAAQFHHVRGSSATGELSAEDQEIYDEMLAAASALEGGRRIKTQANLNGNAPRLNGDDIPSTMFIDQRGQACPLVAKGESFASAVAYQAQVNNRQLDTELVDDGVTFGNMCRSLITGARTSGERAALSGSNSTAGGYLVPEILSAQMIDRFRARSVLFKAGATSMALESDNITFARLTGDPTPAWRRENVEVSESEPTFGAIKMEPRSLAVLVKASRELLQDAPNIGQTIERSIAAALALEVDRVGLLGDGASEPLGIYNDADVNTITSIGGITGHTDIISAYKLLLDDNVPEDPTALVMSNRTWAYYAKLLDGDGQPAQRPPVIENLPFLPTSAVPTTQGGGSDTFMALGWFPDLVFGFRAQLQIEMLRELFASTLQVGFIAHLRVDTATFHPESFCVLKGITS